MKVFKTIVAIMIMIMASLPGYAQQDPDDLGFQDSIIVGAVEPFDSSGEFQSKFVSIYAVTDDSVAFYTLPITWDAPRGGAYFGQGTQYFYPLSSWDRCFDSVLYQEHFVRTVGWANLDTVLNPFLITDGQRVHIWSLRLIIAPNAPPQTITIDTCWDDRNGSALLGLTNGINEITPGILKQEVLLIGPTGTEDPPVPLQFSLAQNYPNPFNPSTNIEFSLANGGHVTLEIYNLLGQRIAVLADGDYNAGIYTARWNGDFMNGTPAPSGIYFYKIAAPGYTDTKKMTLLK
jgi:hypothetical protein